MGKSEERSGGLKAVNKSGGGWGKIKSPWTAFHGSLVFE